MIEAQIVVGLALERRMLTGEWGGFAWRPAAIFSEAPDVAPWTPLGGSENIKRYYAGAVTVCLYSTETANYRDNLTSGEPKLWVVLRAEGPEPPVEVLVVTADPAEGEANTEAGNNTVETIDMPDAIAAQIAAFVDEHHVERPVIKRRRDGAAPDVKWRDGRPPDAKQGGNT